MLQNLPQGVKTSITRSINTAFEQYMKSIEWNEEKYNLEHFIRNWKEYAEKNASWYDKIDGEMKASPKFHEELADKINQTIEKIFDDAPTEKQINELEDLMKKTGHADIEYSCKAEAKFHIERLKEQL